MFQFCNPISVVKEKGDLGKLECQIEFVKPKLDGVTSPELELKDEEEKRISVFIESTIKDVIEDKRVFAGDDSLDEIMEIENDLEEESFQLKLEEFEKLESDNEKVKIINNN